MPTGTVKKIIQDKGFGFIAVEGEQDVFFHISGCNEKFDTMKEGMQVQFDTEESPKGKRAVNVVAS